jgi:hypothetical protein
VAAVPDAAPPVTATAADPARVNAVLAELEALLAQSDTGALALAQAQSELLRAAMGDQFGAFWQRLGLFDFDAALALLRGRREPRAP